MPLLKETHERRLREVADSYRERGYDVRIEPSGEQLPPFLEGFRPDLIARKDGESLVVEVKVGTRSSAIERYRDLAERVNAEPGWRLVVHYVPERGPLEIPEEGAALEFEEIADRIGRSDELHAAGDSDAALVVLWTAVEALLRQHARRDAIPVETLPSNALVKELYSAGEISMEQFDVLEKALKLRNSAAHGFRIAGAHEAFIQLREILRPLAREWYGDSLPNLV